MVKPTTLKKINEEEFKQSSDSIKVAPVAVPSVWEEVDLKQLFLDIFKEHNVLFKTTKKTTEFYPEEISFYHYYKKKIETLTIKERGTETLRKYLMELENNGDILLYDQDRHNAWFNKPGENAATKVDMPFSYRKIIWILRGAAIKKDKEIDPNNIKSKNAKSMIYIYNKDNDARQVLVSFLHDKVNAALGKVMAAEMFQKPGEKKEGKETAEEAYLETFEHQIMFGHDKSYNLRLYTRDITAYMEGRLDRICNCGFRLFTSSSKTIAPVPETKTGEETETKESIQELIAGIDPEAKPGIKIVGKKVYIDVNPADPDKLQEIIDEVTGKFKDLFDELDFDPLDFPKEDTVGLVSLDDNGGLIGYADDNGIEITHPDQEIFKKTRYAYYLSKNSLKKAWSKQAIDDSSVAPQEDLSEVELKAIQKELEKELRCPVCNKLMTKQPFFKTGTFVSQVIDAIEEGLPVIFTGYPGDGKSSLAEYILRYMKWRYGYNYEVYNISEATTAGKLTGRLNMLKIWQPENENVPNAMYGIISLCLFKRTWPTARPLGLASNLLLDELNRCEFKQISFVMSFLAAPYQYVIDDDNFRKVLYPNQRSEDKRWVLVCTMNTEDINNEDISIAAKSRFAFVEVKYTPEDMREIIKEYFNLDDSNSEIINYLMSIYEFTNNAKDQSSVRFPAGIRHLVRIHEIFEKVVKTRMKAYSSRSLLDWKATGKAEDIINKETKNLVGGDKPNSADFLDILDKIVVANLLMAIKDENSASRKKTVDDLWHGTLESFKNNGTLEKVVAAFK